jgi:hypothetical protein
MSDDFERVMANYEMRQKQERNAARAALLALTDQLRAAGVRQVRATFNGYADEGAIESIEFLDAAGQPVHASLSGQFPSLEKTFNVLLPEGYEDNAGSSGTVRLDVDEGRVTVNVDWNVTTTENEHYEV